MHEVPLLFSRRWQQNQILAEHENDPARNVTSRLNRIRQIIPSQLSHVTAPKTKRGHPSIVYPPFFCPLRLAVTDLRIVKRRRGDQDGIENWPSMSCWSRTPSADSPSIRAKSDSMPRIITEGLPSPRDSGASTAPFAFSRGTEKSAANPRDRGYRGPLALPQHLRSTQ